MDDAQQKVIDQIEKLSRVAAKSTNPAEQAAFAAKVTALLAANNLTMSQVEENSTDGMTGRRLDEHVSGGMYKYQQELWKNLAELNFCMYFTVLVPTKEGTRKFRRGRKFTHEHRLVGRAVNVVATKNLAGYLTQSINRICRERLADRTDDITKVNNQFNSSWAIAFREGIVDTVVDKIQERREEALAEEEREIKRKARAVKRAAEKAGVSTATALTLTSVKEREEQANYDFIHGEGAWARKKKEEEEAEKEWAEHLAARAKAHQEAEEEYTRWAEEHPEEARATQQEAEKRERRRAANRRRRAARGGGWGRVSFGSKADRRRDSSAYEAGREAGKKLSIEPQVDGGRKRLTNG